MMSSPFDVIKTILETKKNIMRDSENDELAEKGYNSWLTNIGLSYHIDTLMIANQMNMNHHLANRPQYEYCLNAVRKAKRSFIKWNKKTTDEDLDLVCLIYNVNKIKAKEYLKLLTEDQLNQLRTTQLTGGFKT